MNDNTAESSEQQKWYDKKWLVILLLFLFFPVGFYALYKNSTFGSVAKWSITGAFCLLAVAAAATNPPKQSDGSSSAEKTSSEKEEAFDGGNYGLYRNRGMVYHVINLPPSSAENRTVEGYVLNEDYGCWDENEYTLINVKNKGNGEYFYNMKEGGGLNIKVNQNDETTIYVGPRGNRDEYNELARGGFTDIMSKTCR